MKTKDNYFIPNTTLIILSSICIIVTNLFIPTTMYSSSIVYTGFQITMGMWVLFGAYNLYTGIKSDIWHVIDISEYHKLKNPEFLGQSKWYIDVAGKEFMYTMWKDGTKKYRVKTYKEYTL